MQRIVITGANGAGKTRFASALAAARAELPLVHYDALKLTSGWVQRPRDEIAARLAEQITRPSWILEGGPSLLPAALPRADALVWLDPPTVVRALRLLRRPWATRGKTRPELPDGNPDQVWQQYRFALRSLSGTRAFRAEISGAVDRAGDLQVFHCRTPRATRAALEACAGPVAD